MCFRKNHIVLYTSNNIFCAPFNLTFLLTFILGHLFCIWFTVINLPINPRSLAEYKGFGRVQKGATSSQSTYFKTRLDETWVRRDVPAQSRHVRYFGIENVADAEEEFLAKKKLTLLHHASMKKSLMGH